MPRRLIAPARDQVAFQEFDAPALTEGQVRVRSQFAAAKHGTEMALYKGYAADRGSYDGARRVFDRQGSMVRYPVPLGNMCVGTVVEVAAGVAGIGEGDRVVGHGPFCDEHVWSLQRVRPMPDGMPWQAAVCLDPADFGLGAVRDGHVRLGDAVAVFGMGAIGLMAMQLAKLAGAHPVIAVEPLPLRREAAAACGADHLIDPTAGDAGLEIRALTGDRGADVCIEYSGHVSALQDALRAVTYGGTVVAGAWPGAYPAGLDFGAEAHFNRPKIIFSRACSEPNPDHPAWDEPRLLEMAWRLLSGGQLKTEPVVTPVVPFDELLVAYPAIADDPGSNIKLGASFPD